MNDTLADRDVSHVMMHVKAGILRNENASPASNVVVIDMDSDEFGVSHLRKRAHIAVDGEIGSARPVIGKAIRFAKRVVRRCLRWYIKPSWEEQSAINRELIEAMNRLYVQNEELRAELTVLKHQLTDREMNP